MSDQNQSKAVKTYEQGVQDATESLLGITPETLQTVQEAFAAVGSTNIKKYERLNMHKHLRVNLRKRVEQLLKEARETMALQVKETIDVNARAKKILQAEEEADFRSKYPEFFNIMEKLTIAENKL